MRVAGRAQERSAQRKPAGDTSSDRPHQRAARGPEEGPGVLRGERLVQPVHSLLPDSWGHPPDPSKRHRSCPAIPEVNSNFFFFGCYITEKVTILLQPPLSYHGIRVLLSPEAKPHHSPSALLLPVRTSPWRACQGHSSPAPRLPPLPVPPCPGFHVKTKMHLQVGEGKEKPPSVASLNTTMLTGWPRTRGLSQSLHDLVGDQS